MDLRAHIELFHLLFLKSLLTHQDKALIVLKGGCNLRFFHGSSRYSEDIDLDVMTIAKDTLKKRVDKVLSSQILATNLAARGMRIGNYSAPKQTDTVQRWKVSISAARLILPTKIEFSRRGVDHDGVMFEPIDPSISAYHKVSSIFLSHYDARYAMIQKIEALAGRPETQARDIFDLDLIMGRNPKVSLSIAPPLVDQAVINAMSVDFDQFQGQVVEFLPDDAKNFYQSSEVWLSLQERVVAKLESLGR